MAYQSQHIRLSDNSMIAVEEFLSAAFSSLCDYSIFTVDSDLVINCWSTGAVRQLGYQAEEAIGQRIDIIYTALDRIHGLHLQDRKTALQEGKACGNRWYLPKDGSRFFAYGLLYPIRDKNDRLLGFVKVLKDITQRKIAEEHIKGLEVSIARHPGEMRPVNAF